MVTILENFNSMQLTDLALIYPNDVIRAVDCVGSLTGETETRTLIKRCAGVESDSVTIPVKLNLTLSAHIDIETGRDLFGLSNDGLVAGVYAYGKNVKTKPFVLTGTVVDPFQNDDNGMPLRKYIAFPIVKSTTGLAMTIDNTADEYAELSLTMSAYFDNAGNAYYEAHGVEITPDVANSWMSDWSYELVAASTTQPTEPTDPPETENP